VFGPSSFLITDMSTENILCTHHQPLWAAVLVVLALVVGVQRGRVVVGIGRVEAEGPTGGPAVV